MYDQSPKRSYTRFVTAPRADVVGIGENSVDLVSHTRRVCLRRRSGQARPALHLATPNAKFRASAHVVSCGGQVATTLAGCAALGLRTLYVGTFGDDANGQRARDTLTDAGVDLSHAVVRHAPNRHAVILVDEGNGDRTVVWHRDPQLAMQVDDIPASVVSHARLVHVDDLDEHASIAAARIAVGAGVLVTSDIDRVTEQTPALIASSTVPIFSAHVPGALTGERDPERALR